MSHTLFASGYGGTIYTLSFDPGQNTLVQTSSISAGDAPTWLTKQASLLYTGDEFAPGKDGRVMVYSIKQDSSLDLVSDKGAGGAGPCHFALSPSNSHLFSANYAGGTLGTIALEQDGSFRKTDRQDEQYKFVGAGPQVSSRSNLSSREYALRTEVFPSNNQTDRQEAPHPHGVFVDPTGKFLLVPDLGADAVRIFNINSEDDTLQQADQAHITPGSGPRHLIFTTPTSNSNDPKSSSQTLCYLVNELSNTVGVFEVVYPATKHDHLKLKAAGKQSVSFLPPDAGKKGWTGAEIAITPDRKYLIVSNRSPDEPKPKDNTDVLSILTLKPNGHIDTAVEVQFVPIKGRYYIARSLVCVLSGFSWCRSRFAPLFPIPRSLRPGAGVFHRSGLSKIR